VRAERLIETCVDRPSPELDELQGYIDRVQSAAAEFYYRMMTSAPFRCADEAEEAIRHELVPLKDALLAALDLLNERIASRKARRQLQ
jgi:hypothetical protein